MINNFTFSSLAMDSTVVTISLIVGGKLSLSLFTTQTRAGAQKRHRETGNCLFALRQYRHRVYLRSVGGFEYA